MGSSLTDLLVAHLGAASFDAIPAATVARAKTRLLDALGLISAGARAQGSPELVSLVQSWGGREDATVLTTGQRVPAANAAMSNAVLMRSYDFEPVGADRADGQQLPAHITGTTVAVALAVGEAVGASGREMLSAIILGDDIAARLGHAVGFDVYGGGDNTGTINVVGGTVVASLLYGHDEATLRRAIGLAINQAGGTIDNINDKTLAFKLPIAFSARNAVISAELAAVGFGGPVDPIGGKHGFLAQWSDAPNPEALTVGLGEEFFADAVIKPWPSCRASQPAITAAARLVADSAVRPDDIVACRVRVTPRVKDGFVGQPFAVGSSPEVSAAFSIQFGVATTLLNGTIGLRHMTEEYMRSTELGSMLERVELEGSLDATAGSTAEIEIVTRSGDVITTRAERGLGDVRFSPETAEAIIAKYAQNMSWGGVDVQRQEALRAIVADLETRKDVREIAPLLVV